MRNVIATPLPAASRVFGWTLAETRQTALALMDQGRLSLDVHVSGIRELQMVTNILAKVARK